MYADITWCSKKRLQLNAGKTEVMWFGTMTNLNHQHVAGKRIAIDSTVIEPTSVVRDLGVFFDAELSIKARSCHADCADLLSSSATPALDAATSWPRRSSAARIGTCPVAAGLLQRHPCWTPSRDGAPVQPHCSE
jgi:hypothetical protein